MNLNQELKDRFSNRILSLSEPYEKTFIVEVKREDLPRILDYVYNSLNGYFMTMSGSDSGDTGDYYLLDYVLGWYNQNLLLIVRTRIPKNDPNYPTLISQIPCSDWYEREAKEDLGLTPVGHPNPKKLLLSDDWPEGVYPFRKSYHHDERPPYNEKAMNYSFSLPQKDVNLIPYGPYHFSIHEPIYFRFYVNGERIVGADIRAGFNYRGLEKVAESRLTYETIPFISERICGICGSTHGECYTQALEKAADADIPERAQWIRCILLEIERMHSHLLWLGFASHMVGFDSGLMQFWRVREKDMILAELLTGNRKNYGMIVPGGVRRDIREDKKRKALNLISQISEEYEELAHATLKLKTLTNRLQDIGYLSKEDAQKYSVMGPVARASGISIDTRRDYPYEAYRHFDFEIPVMPEGDVLARTKIRALETVQSLNIVKQALDSLPEGPVNTPIDYISPGKTSIGLVEGPRGTDVHYIITGKENTVHRWRVRAPTYANLPVTPFMLEGYTLADAPVIIGSVDPCISCMERIQVINIKTRKTVILSGHDLKERH